MMTLNHGFSGYVCGRMILPLVSRYAPVGQGWLAFAVFLGAMLPDIDSIVNLLGRGAYFSGAWYGHRNASHSLVGTLILAMVFAAPLAGIATAVSRRRTAIPWSGAYRWLAPALWAGGLLHMVGDFFTPGMPMPVFWPLAGDYGAMAHIGWFSPVLLWAFLATLTVDGFLRGAGGYISGLSRWRLPALWALNTCAAAGWLGFLVFSRYESSAQWGAYQNRLLPDVLTAPMAAAVHAAWHWMVR